LAAGFDSPDIEPAEVVAAVAKRPARPKNPRARVGPAEHKHSMLPALATANENSGIQPLIPIEISDLEERVER
jgi:hypothetical protein